MIRASFSFISVSAVVLACASSTACSSSSSGGSPAAPGEDGGETHADAAPTPFDAGGVHETSTGAQPDAGGTTDAAAGGCQLSASSMLLSPTLTFKSGSSTTDCASTSSGNVWGATCTLQPTGACTASATCTLEIYNADNTGGMATATGTVTVSGTTATGSLSYTDESGDSCQDAITGALTVPVASPMACMVSCDNGTPNNEMGCDPCMMKACAAAYGACMADNETGGCITCGQLLTTNGASGINCTNTPRLIGNLMNCACLPQTCD
jgi:hypothetical protein